MKKYFLLVLLVMLSPSVKAVLLIDSVKNILGVTIGKYQKIEVEVASTILDPSSTPTLNPYNPYDVDMYAIFTAPDGKKYRRNAFWYSSFTRYPSRPNNIFFSTAADSCDKGWNDVAEKQYPNPDAYLEPLSENYPWRVRFTPPQTGSWSYKVYYSDQFASFIDCSGKKSFGEHSIS